MRHVRFICFLTLLALIPYTLHVWLWVSMEGAVNGNRLFVGTMELFAGIVLAKAWFCTGGDDVVKSIWRACWALCSNELKLWKGEE